MAFTFMKSELERKKGIFMIRYNVEIPFSGGTYPVDVCKYFNGMR